MRTLLLASLTLAAAPAALAQDPAGAAIDRAVAAHERLRSVQATFEQTLTNPLTGRTMVARGEFLQKKPDLLVVRFDEPAGDRIVTDGRALWLYLPSTNPGQVMKMPLTEAGAGSVDLTAQFLDAPRVRYTITDRGAATVGGRAARAVELVPRQPTHFTRATVWIDEADGTIRQFEVHDASGVTRKIRLLSMRKNPTIPASAFKFEPPAGTRVIDRTAGS